MELRFTLGSRGMSRHTSKEAAKGPLMVTGRGIRRLLDPTPSLSPLEQSTTGPKKAGRGFETLRTWDSYPDRP